MSRTRTQRVRIRKVRAGPEAERPDARRGPERCGPRLRSRVTGIDLPGNTEFTRVSSHPAPLTWGYSDEPPGVSVGTGRTQQTRRPSFPKTTHAPERGHDRGRKDRPGPDCGMNSAERGAGRSGSSKARCPERIGETRAQIAAAGHGTRPARQHRVHTGQLAPCFVDLGLDEPPGVSVDTGRTQQRPSLPKATHAPERDHDRGQKDRPGHNCAMNPAERSGPRQ